MLHRSTSAPGGHAPDTVALLRRRVSSSGPWFGRLRAPRGWSSRPQHPLPHRQGLGRSQAPPRRRRKHEGIQGEAQQSAGALEAAAGPCPFSHNVHSAASLASSSRSQG
jgi:hypothetical protein